MAMHTRTHPLQHGSIGCQYALTSLHYGQADGSRRAYLQASLHADELPGMLVLHHLRQLLAAADAQDAIQGEIVLLPFANPLGLAQRLMHDPQGRFELNSGENFNRLFPDYYALVRDQVAPLLGQQAEHNRDIVRAAIHDALARMQPGSALAALRHTLSTLAQGSDLVLDLHCDREAVLHLYTDEPFWPDCEALARYLGVAVTVLGRNAGGSTFEESCGQVWWRLAREFAAQHPLAPGCVSATIELRGQGDLQHEQARRDAAAIYAFLQRRGHIAGDAPELPPPVARPMYWEGMQSLVAPHAGLLVHTRPLGASVRAGESVAEVIDVQHNRVSAICSASDGILYARQRPGYFLAGAELCRVVGHDDTGHGAVMLA
ncbi:succinylglutamate desuccinylase/aspartoacylase family protein [Vogesella sp. LIG4]|uniref:succinylglutamate desuccinylase/aspartoacylase family protein n=1 Tax=Vogesella sp. LIG4 TaxID=1192162 RepID=UPI00081F81DE|nr:succinylglutamate desuccinylase/aspartoacylase family protein [Vogesella sp. LIG4]SCK09546.1 hypothetical protein PSELUDRAFT_0650 [Vogesella sp. LIG4]